MWRRVLRERRVVVLPLAVALALNVLAYVVVVRPLQAKSVGSAGRAASAAGSLVAAERELAQAQKLVSGKAQADQELAAFYQNVLPADLTAARRMTYASLPALAHRTNVRYEARTTSVDDKDKESHLGHMSIRMVLEGDYRDIRRFIYQLETATDFVIIDDLTLTDGTSAEPQRLTISLSTYYRVGASAG
ncbi:MAG: GspMb/PilO family protein [Vicinamibacterales bacterium]